MTHFYTIAQALIMFPGFMNAASLRAAREMWETIRGTPPKKVKLFRRGRSHAFKKGKRMDFRQSKCHSSNRTYRDGLNYLRRLNKLPKLTVGVAVCLSAGCGHKTLMTASKRNHRFFCGDCKRLDTHQSGYVQVDIAGDEVSKSRSIKGTGERKLGLSYLQKEGIKA